MRQQHRSRISFGLLVALLFVSSVVTTAFAQYAPGMTGQANDANNQLGTGGINSPVQQQYFNTANLYVTGNVTGGRQFRGYSPIRNSSSLFVGLPSSGISAFEGYAVGVQDVQQNRTFYQTNPFFNRSNTVTSVGAINAGLNNAGGSTLSNPYLIPDSAGLTAGDPRLNRPIRTDFGLATYQDAAPTSSIYNANNLPFWSERYKDVYGAALPHDELGASPLFSRSVSQTQPLESINIPSANTSVGSGEDALFRTSRLSPIVRQRRTIADLGAYDRTGTGEDGEAAERPLLNTVGSRFGQANLDPSLFGANTTPLQPLGGENVGTSFTGVGEGSSFGGTYPVGQTAEPRLTGGGMFNRLAVAVQLVERQREEGVPVTEQQQIAPEQRALYNQAVAVIEAGLGENAMVTAMQDKGRVGEYLRAAEDRMAQGRYYEAASQFRLAMTVAPDNPMVRLGLGNALLAAGEYMTAVHHITVAADEYPAFGVLSLDLTDFIPDAQVIDVRRADLERKLKDEEEYRLRFLLGYMEYYLDLDQFAIPNLKKAAEEAPEGSIVARFPEILNLPQRLGIEKDTNK